MRPPKPSLPAHQRHLLVCTGRQCTADGMDAQALHNLGNKLIRAGLLQPGPQRVKPSRVDCLGACRSGPVVCVQPDGAWYWGVTPEDFDRIISQHLLGGQIVHDLLFHRGPDPGAETAP